MYTFAHKHTDAKITILTDDRYEAMVSLVSTVQTPSHWVMLEDGKINEQVLYTEEEVKHLTIQAMSDALAWVRAYIKDSEQGLDHEEWWEKHKKH